MYFKETIMFRKDTQNTNTSRKEERMTMTENFKAIHPILGIISDGVTNHNEELFRKARKMSIDAFLSNKITESEFDSLIITIASIFSVLRGGAEWKKQET